MAKSKSKEANRQAKKAKKKNKAEKAGRKLQMSPLTNGVPVAQDDTYTMHHDVTLTVSQPGVLSNDSDPDNDPLTVTDWGAPTLGSVIGAADGSFEYLNNVGQYGTDTFTYTISDGTDTATATVTIQMVNSPPLAVDDAYAMHFGNTLNVTAPGVLANDSDSDNDPLTITWGSGTHGSVVGHPDGSFEYTPPTDFVGVETFTYSISDGPDTDVATVTIQVQNNPPVAQNDGYPLHHDTDLTKVGPGVLSNDFDPDDDPITVTEWGTPANGTVSGNLDGGFVYTPPTGFVGNDTFTYRITDGAATDTAMVLVQVRNNAPVAQNDGYVVMHDTDLTKVGPGVLSNDYDPDDDPITVTDWGTPSHGSVMGNVDGGFTYTPDPAYFGFDTFTYRITDGVATDTATVTVLVKNSEPVAQNDGYVALHDMDLVRVGPGVLSNDYDPDNDPITVTEWGTPTHGTVMGSYDGGFTYTPAAGFVGNDTFTYRITDGTAATDTATVLVQVRNEPPTARDDGYIAQKDTLFARIGPGVMSNDFDPDSDTTLVVEWGSALNGTVNGNQDGGFTYMPDSMFVGNDSFTYRISDGIDTDTATVIIRVE